MFGSLGGSIHPCHQSINQSINCLLTKDVESQSPDRKKSPPTTIARRSRSFLPLPSHRQRLIRLPHFVGEIDLSSLGWWFCQVYVHVLKVFLKKDHSPKRRFFVGHISQFPGLVKFPVITHCNLILVCCWSCRSCRWVLRFPATHLFPFQLGQPWHYPLRWPRRRWNTWRRNDPCD